MFTAFYEEMLNICVFQCNLASFKILSYWIFLYNYWFFPDAFFQLLKLGISMIDDYFSASSFSLDDFTWYLILIFNMLNKLKLLYLLVIYRHLI